MNWIALSAVAETIGVIALIVSLIYLAIQIRQNTEQVSHTLKAAELSAFERNVASGNATREMFLVYPELATLFLKGNRDYDNLQFTDKFRYEMLLRNLFSAFQGAYIRQLTARDDPFDSDGFSIILDSILKNSGARSCLAQASMDWRKEFSLYVESRMQHIDEQEPATE